MRRVGLIGFGAVGKELARLLAETRDRAELTVVGGLVRHPEHYGSSGAELGGLLVGDLASLLDLQPEVVVEAAGHEAFRTYVPDVLRHGIDVLAISTGALADDSIWEAATAAARQGRARLRIPSGAIAGLDALGAAALGGLDRVVHEVRKPPAALLAPDQAAEVLHGGRARELFAGSAREVALRFPANANVVATVALVGLGLDRTTARVIADPGVTRNTHVLLAEGEFGRLEVKIENTPSENPKTGRIVPLSLLRALRNLDAPVIIGG